MRTARQNDAVKKPGETTDDISSANDRLIGVPGLGPARISALQAAGVTTRTALAQASVDQLVGMTGMPRSQAEKALAAVRGTASPAVTPAPPTDEMMPDASVSGGVPEQPKPEPTDPEPETASGDDLTRAILTISTSLSETTQRFPKLEEALTKLARRLEKMPKKARSLSDKKQSRIASDLDDLTAHLEHALRHADDVSKADLKKLRDRIDTERAALKKS